MTTTFRVPPLKTWQLSHCAWLTGMPGETTRAALHGALTTNLQLLPARLERKKIVSVDMGIRNMAFCVIEPQASSVIKVSEWKRMDLLDLNIIVAGFDHTLKTTKRKQTGKINVPANMAKLALHVTQELLGHSPEAILIERQRFRTRGAHAVQEWTLLVNMLESMLWSCLETLRSAKTGGAFPQVHALEPMRVAAFWTPRARTWPLDILRERSDLTHRQGYSGRTLTSLDKKMKVDIVRSWVAGESEVQVEFDGAAATTAEAFKIDRRKKKEIESLAGGKIDDLADCLLQAVAWVKWQENKYALREMWTETTAGGLP